MHPSSSLPLADSPTIGGKRRHVRPRVAVCGTCRFIRQRKTGKKSTDMATEHRMGRGGPAMGTFCDAVPLNCPPADILSAYFTKPAPMCCVRGAHRTKTVRLRGCTWGCPQPPPYTARPTMNHNVSHEFWAGIVQPRHLAPCSSLWAPMIDSLFGGGCARAAAA